MILKKISSIALVFSFMFLFACVFIPVLEDHYNPRLVKELLQDLSSTLHSLTIHGRCVLVGNVNIWLCRLETIVKWQQELNNLQIPKVFLLKSQSRWTAELPGSNLK